MEQVLTITALATEEFIDPVVGFGNFAIYIDLRSIQVGDSLTIILYKDIVGTGDNVIISRTIVTEATQAISGDKAALELPFAISDLQTARLGITLTAGTTPLAIPVQTLNIGTGA